MSIKLEKILEKKVLTTKEASLLIGVSLPSIINWADAKKFSSFKTPGGHRRIPTEEFLQFARDKGYTILELKKRIVKKTGRSIVIIDTDKDYLETLQDYLLIVSKGNLEVHTCSDAFGAGILVAQEQPSILVVDQQKNVLPKDFGFYWKEKFPNLKVVMLTNHLNNDSLQQLPSEYILINKGNSIQDVSKAISSLL